MIIDSATFTELCVRLKLASDGVLRAATALQGVSGGVGQEEVAQWAKVIDGMAGTLGSIDYIEKLLYAVLHAQDATYDGLEDA